MPSLKDGIPFFITTLYFPIKDSAKGWIIAQAQQQ
jgi:hypothetical protein